MSPIPRFSASRRAMLRLVLTGTVMLGGVGMASGRAFADALGDVKQRGELAVATEAQFPPFDYIENGTYRGLDRDLIDEVGKELGVKVKYIDLPWSSVLPGLDAKKFDFVIAPVTVTRERMKRYAFTVPIAEATAALMKRANDHSIQRPQDVAGKNVGGQKGTAQLEQFKQFAATLPKQPVIKEYVDNNQSYADLAAARLDASISSLPNLAYAVQQRPDTFALVLPPFGKPTYFSWVGRLGDHDKSLVEAISAALVELDNDGRMAAIEKKWLGRTGKLPTTVPAPSI